MFLIFARSASRRSKNSPAAGIRTVSWPPGISGAAWMGRLESDAKFALQLKLKVEAIAA
jgi:hypothetical protein